MRVDIRKALSIAVCLSLFFMYVRKPVAEEAIAVSDEIVQAALHVAYPAISQGDIEEFKITNIWYPYTDMSDPVVLANNDTGLLWVSTQYGSIASISPTIILRIDNLRSGKVYESLVSWTDHDYSADLNALHKSRIQLAGALQIAEEWYVQLLEDEHYKEKKQKFETDYGKERVLFNQLGALYLFYLYDEKGEYVWQLEFKPQNANNGWFYMIIGAESGEIYTQEVEDLFQTDNEEPSW